MPLLGAGTQLINHLILLVLVLCNDLHGCTLYARLVARHNNKVRVNIYRARWRRRLEGMQHDDGLHNLSSGRARMRALQAGPFRELRVVGLVRADTVLVGELAQLHVHASANVRAASLK